MLPSRIKARAGKGVRGSRSKGRCYALGAQAQLFGHQQQVVDGGRIGGRPAQPVQQRGCVAGHVVQAGDDCQRLQCLGQ